MISLKKLLTAGLIFSLTLPIAVFGAENKNGESLIKDDKGTKFGLFACELSTEEWAREITLEASAAADEGKILPEVSYQWKYNETTCVQKTGSYTISENGIYTVELQFPENSKLSADEIQIEVDNIDQTGPEIVQVIKDKEGWTNGPVVLTFECEDYQEKTQIKTTEISENNGEESTDSPSVLKEEQTEREKGSGLHPEGAYSYDGGKTWTDKNTITVSENQTINFVVRDALENKTEQTVTVDNIDTKEPTVRVSIADGGVLYEGESGSVILSASASDETSGLADMAYSWDGGLSWNNGNTIQVSQPGNYTVLVRDKAGNFTQATLSVTYASRPSGNGGGNSGDSPSTGSQDGGSSSSVNTGDNNSGSSNSANTGDNNSGSGQMTSSYPIYYGSSTSDNNNNVKSESRETGERETKKTEKTKETEKTKKTESETKESLKEPVMIKGSDSKGGFPWLLMIVGAAAIAAVAGAVIVVKKISGQGMSNIKVDDASDDMADVYARVSAEEIKAVSDPAESETENGSHLQEGISGVSGDTVDLGSKVSAIVAEETVLNVEKPEIIESEADIRSGEVLEKEVDPEIEPENMPEEEIKPEAEPEAGTEPEQVPAEEAESGVDTEPEQVPAEEAESGVDTEPEQVPVEEVESEAGTEPKKVPEVEVAPKAKTGTDKVVLEGEHSRLVYDPETGEYKYEFK